ncbi:MAG: hypothetical protein PGN16_19430 [Sphingomonas phyllosphaerae]
MRGGIATLGVSSPLRLDHASGLALVPLSYDLTGGALRETVQRLDLTPQTREWDIELGWSAAVGERGAIRLGIAHAVDAGHVAGAHDTAGFVSVTLR